MVPDARDAGAGKGRDGRTAEMSRFLGRSSASFGLSDSILAICCRRMEKKAISSEAKASELQARISVLHEEIERSQCERHEKTSRAGHTSINQETQNETEKRVLMCRLKENRCAKDDGCKARTCTGAGLLPRRYPLREIGNTSALMKQH